jgi:lipopolysaccharide/colanic/teichoic acid biosynthesis glycosyltransferase
VGKGGGNALSRLLDLVVATLALVVSSPLLLAAAIAIRLESRGSPIYRQRRVGRGGEAFELLKLRTMVEGAETMGAGLAVDEDDPRITRVGALLRRFSLDELPNLLNVLRGEMAVVGPRPTVQWQVDHYSERQRRRIEVKPGITGWAQVHGRASLPWHERIELDVTYVENRSLWLDLRILTKTMALLVTGRGLYRGETGGWRPPDDGAGSPPSRSG